MHEVDAVDMFDVVQDRQHDEEHDGNGDDETHHHPRRQEQQHGAYNLTESKPFNTRFNKVTMQMTSGQGSHWLIESSGIAHHLDPGLCVTRQFCFKTYLYCYHLHNMLITFHSLIVLCENE